MTNEEEYEYYDLKRRFNKGLDNLWFEHYLPAKEDFEHVIYEVFTMGIPIYPPGTTSGEDPFYMLKMNSCFGQGFAEGMLEMQQRESRYRSALELAEVAREFNTAALNLTPWGDDAYKQLGRSYAVMGFSKEAITLLNSSKETYIFDYYTRPENSLDQK